ncbi:MAG: (2Fe-2S)-binding protein [Nakamurella sp.]
MTTSVAAQAGSPVEGQLRRLVEVTVNGVHRSAEVEVRRTLADFLRHDLALTGTHVGCEHGVCGACTVLLDGLPVRSCLLFAVTVAGHAITTIEGLGLLQPDGVMKPSPVQQAFRDCHGLQCGFCTPGMLTTITAGLEANPHPTAEQAVDMIAGNLCRCTGYQNIVEAVLRAAELIDNPDAPLPDEGFDEESEDVLGSLNDSDASTKARTDARRKGEN